MLAKWDVSEVTIEDVRPELQRRLRQRPDFITVSSISGRGISRLLDKVTELYDRYADRISTADLNKLIGELKEERQAPSKGQRRLNLLYGAQVSTRPPRFRFTVNDPGLVTRDYGYWVENQLRERLGLEGVPVVVDFRAGPECGQSSSARARGGRRSRTCSAAAATTCSSRGAASRRRAVCGGRARRTRGPEPRVPRGTRPRRRRRADLSLDEGARPASGERLSTLVTIGLWPSSRARTWRTRCSPGYRARPSRVEDQELAVRLQHALNSLVFRVYVNDDVIGVELCGAAKNVIALAAGGVDGLGLGDNAKAALITRGLVEMARLGEAFGAQPETFSGLAGMGDLMVDLFPPERAQPPRRRADRARRDTRRGAREIGQVVEGLTTAPVLRDLSRRIGVELPITEGVCAVLEGRPLHELAESLMGRRPTEE